MKFMTVAALALLGAGLSGCVSVFEGTSQDIHVVTNPSGANCEFQREGQTIGYVPSTPGSVTVRKSKHDLLITCKKEGYEDAVYYNHSGVSAAIAANVAVDVLLTAGISSIVDSATGADNKYESAVNLSMIEKKQATTPVASMAPVTEAE